PSRRMSEHRLKDDWQSDSQRQKPINEMRQIPTQGQLLAIVDLEGNEHQDIGGAHSGDVEPYTIRPARTEQRATEPTSTEREKTQGEEVIVVGPAHQRQDSGRNEERQLTPEINRSCA